LAIWAKECFLLHEAGNKWQISIHRHVLRKVAFVMFNIPKNSRRPLLPPEVSERNGVVAELKAVRSGGGNRQPL
jgi:hypothetical protein